MTTPEPDRSASRRTLLRRAAVTGGAAVAATAATAVNAAPAAAASGDPVTIGLPNSGGATTVTSAAPAGAATLALRNPTGATLQLEMSNFHTGGPAGAITAYSKGLNVTNGNGDYTAFSTANATMLVPIPPTRILDTRSAAGRARLLEGGGRIDSQGRAIADTYLVVHLRDIAQYADGMIGNVTVANTEKGGFATVFGRGDLPNASTINWWGTGQLLSNGVITQLGGYETAGGDYYEDTVAIYVQRSATAVILDVTGLLVFHPESAVINNPKAISGAGLAADSDAAGVRAKAIKEAAERGDRQVQTGA